MKPRLSETSGMMTLTSRVLLSTTDSRSFNLHGPNRGPFGPGAPSGVAGKPIRKCTCFDCRLRPSRPSRRAERRLGSVRAFNKASHPYPPSGNGGIVADSWLFTQPGSKAAVAKFGDKVRYGPTGEMQCGITLPTAGRASYRRRTYLQRRTAASARSAMAES